MRNGAEQEPRTLRSLWYSLVKPALSRMGILDKTTAKGNPIDWAGKLSDYTADLVRDGITTYEELRIIDGSRQRRPAQDVGETVASVNLVGAHYPWLIIFTEKDTIWNVIRSLASLYGVTAISGGGQPSYACTENVLKAIWDSGVYDLGLRQYSDPIILLTFTDHDPHGYDIAEAQLEQLRELADGRCDVHYERLGLYPSQLAPEQRQKNAYKTKATKRKLRKWYERTGGVDGKPLGLELDALPLSRVRRMFAQGIEQRIDLSDRQADLPLALLDLLAWEVLREELDIEAKLDAMKLAVRSDGLYRTDVIQTELPSDLFEQAAVAGWDKVNPVTTTYEGDSLYHCKDRVKAVMRKALESAV